MKSERQTQGAFFYKFDASRSASTQKTPDSRRRTKERIFLSNIRALCHGVPRVKRIASLNASSVGGRRQAHG